MVGAQRTEGPRTMNRMGLPLQYFLRYADGEDITRLLLGTNHGCIVNQTKSKHASVQWKHSSSPSVRRFKVMPSAGKVMHTMFCYSQGVLLAPFLKRGENVDSAVHRKCRG
jgi:hypothetical protein